MTPSLEGLPTKAKEAPFPNISMSWGRKHGIKKVDMYMESYFSCYLAGRWPTLGHIQMDSLTTLRFKLF